MFAMTFVASACVITSAVDAGVEWTKGFYYLYANHSSIGNLLYLWEAILILGWQFWGFMQVIFVTSFASDVWK